MEPDEIKNGEEEQEVPSGTPEEAGEGPIEGSDTEQIEGEEL